MPVAAPKQAKPVSKPASSAGRAAYYSKTNNKKPLAKVPARAKNNIKPTGKAKEATKGKAPNKPIQVLTGTIASINKASESTQKHESVDKKVADTQKSAVLTPDKANESVANRHQVEVMGVQKTQKFNANTFKEKLKTSIEKSLPTKEEQGKKFKEKGVEEKIQDTINKDFEAQKQNAGGAIEQASQDKPQTPPQEVSTQAPVPLKEENKGKTPVIAKNSPVMPTPQPASYSNMDAEAKTLDDKLAENNISEKTLKNSNEPNFSAALTQKSAAQTQAKNSTKDYQAIEKGTLNAGKVASQESISKSMGGMFGQRTGAFDKNLKDQNTQKAKEERIRQQVATDLNNIYNDTKTKVDGIFKDLDAYINTTFDKTLATNVTLFEEDAKRLIDENDGIEWLGKVITGQKIQSYSDIFLESLQNFNNRMNPVIDAVAIQVESKLNEATAAIEAGKTKTESYWKSQGSEVQKIAQSIYDSVNGKYAELEQAVEAKEGELIEVITTKFKESVESLEESFNNIKEANKGFLEQAMDAVVGVVQAILDIKNTLTKLLGAMIEAIDAIVTDPIGFLKNLFNGISLGFKNFGTNFLKHLMGGFITWLTGALGGITIPDDIFSLKGIFSLVMQVLGLSWDYIRAKTVKLIGEPAMKVLETGFEMFMIFREKGLAGIWEYLKEKFDDLKAKVIDEIQSMIQSQVIEAGIKWVIGLSNPVGAFIKAALAIVDMVKFFFQKAQEIIALVDAVTQSILNIARGNIGFVATAVENALAKAVPVVIGFLASLLGIGSLAEKVKNIITKIRAKIDGVIDGFIEKAKAWVKKLGVTKALNKGVDAAKAKVAKGKAYAIAKKDKAVATAKKVAGKFLNWLGIKKKFKANDGETHTLFFEGTNESPVLMIASAKMQLPDWINKMKTGKSNEYKKELDAVITLYGDYIDKKNKVDKLNKEIREITKNPDADDDAKVKEKQKEIDDIKPTISGLIDKISQNAAIIFGHSDKDLPNFKGAKTYKGGLNSNNFGTEMFADDLSIKDEGGNKKSQGSEPSGGTRKDYEVLLLRKNGAGSYYVRGHLLNAQIHGSGSDLKNLTPLSKQGNDNHKRDIEAVMKFVVYAGAVVDYTVKPIYGRGLKPFGKNDKYDGEQLETINKIRVAENGVPTGLQVTASLQKKENDKWVFDKDILTGKIDNPIETDKIDDYEIGEGKPPKIFTLKGKSLKELQGAGISTDVADKIFKRINPPTSLKITDYEKQIGVSDKDLLKQIQENDKSYTGISQ